MTLTDAACLTRKIMLFSAIFFVIAFSAWIGYRYYYFNVYLPSIPPIEEKPDIKFGVLNKPVFVKNNLSSSNYSYSLDTQTGEVPKNLPKLMKVYFSPQIGTNLLALDRAKDLANKLLFDLGPEIITPTNYKFSDSLGGELFIDLNSGNFHFQRPLPNDTSNLQQEVELADSTKLTADFKNYLSSKGILKDLLQSGEVVAFYNNTDKSKSERADISLWQEKIDDYPLITAKFTRGLVSTTVTKYKTEREKYLKLDFIYWEIDKKTFATYPIISAERAFANLKEGQASIVIEPSKNLVSITDIYLAYLLTEEYTPYIQPVFVFEGENFAALVSAIEPNYLK